MLLIKNTIKTVKCGKKSAYKKNEIFIKLTVSISDKKRCRSAKKIENLIKSLKSHLVQQFHRFFVLHSTFFC